jgi:CrcB protein
MTRFAVATWIQSIYPASTFPWGTFVVNVTGCFVIGVVAQVAESSGLLTPQLRALLVIGFLGGYTTFSTFANEGFALAQDADWSAATVYLGGQVVLGLVAVWLGRALIVAAWR